MNNPWPLYTQKAIDEYNSRGFSKEYMPTDFKTVRKSLGEHKFFTYPNREEEEFFDIYYANSNQQRYSGRSSVL